MNDRFFTGYFATESDLRKTAEAIHAMGVQIDEIYSPYPLHGMETLVGYRPSRLAQVGFCAGLVGLLSATYFQFWTSGFDWPLIVGGKPVNSWPAFTPVAFEVTILFAGVCTFVALIFRTKLWSPRNRPALPTAVDNQFVLVVREADAALNLAEVEKMFLQNGALATWEGVTVGQNDAE